MSKHKFELEIDVDDAAVAAHVERTHGNGTPQKAEVDEWDWVDLVTAARNELVVSIEVVDYSALS